jgi:hypothetical protein
MIPEFLSQPVSRRQFTLGSALGVAALTLMPSRTVFTAAAQDASDLSGLGYPELAITITETGFEGVPDSPRAGRYLLKVTSKITKDSGSNGAVAFISPTPAGMSAADFIQLAASSAATPAAGGTPIAGGDQGGGDENQQIPLSVYQMRFAGGVTTSPGGTAEAVIDLTAGEYVVWGDDPTAVQKPVILTVTGDFPNDVKDPQADITATLIDFAIQLEGNLTAGKHLMKVQHHGAQPHFLYISKGPDTMTTEQVQTALMGDPSATPAPGGLLEQDLQPVFYSPTQSIGTVTYQQIELTAGTFLATCFFPTAGTGVPHAMNGMIDVFKVTG